MRSDGSDRIQDRLCPAPVMIRWQGKLAALYLRCEALVEKMAQRGYRHASSLDRELATGLAVQDAFADLLGKQIDRGRGNGCECAV